MFQVRWFGQICFVIGIMLKWNRPRKNLPDSFFWRVQVHPQDGVGYFSNEREFSVKSSIQRISSHFFAVETKRLFGSFCKGDLDVANLRPALWQGCGKQTPSARKLFFLANLLYVPISKCRGDWDLGLCTTSGLAFEEPQRNGKIGFLLRRDTFFVFWKSPLRIGSQVCTSNVKITFTKLPTNRFVSTTKNRWNAL